jgi:hypothetical protein
MTSAPPKNPNNLGNAPTFRNISWMDMCVRAWGTEWNAPDHGVYCFSNGRRFDSTDKGSTGIYNGGITSPPDNPPGTFILNESELNIGVIS